MTQVPTTSVTLLKALSGESDSARWTEFFRKYEGPMRAFLAARYPSVEADDVIQETLKALAKRLPNYHYVPDEKGHFHNYLMGIVRHKADDAIRAQARARYSAMSPSCTNRRRAWLRSSAPRATTWTR